jgi:hypothetical protein
LIKLEDGCRRADVLVAIQRYTVSTSPAALNCDDMLRSAVVLAVSSFDLYVHDVFRSEVVYRLQNLVRVERLKIPFESVISNQEKQVMVIDDYIRKENSYKSFVAPDKLAECLRSFVSTPWSLIAEQMGLSDEECKGKLRRIIDLRNRIAHEADINPNYGGAELWPIYVSDVENSIMYVRNISRAIATVVDCAA